MNGRTGGQGTACKRCNAPLPSSARRCMRCGAQVFVATEVDPAEAARLERQALRRKYPLDETQKQILEATATGNGQVFVFGTDKGEEGEVKAGEQRFFGNDTVAAVAGIAAQGLIAPAGEDCFTITDAGIEYARAQGWATSSSGSLTG